MRIVALEEHYTVPAIAGRVPEAAVAARGFPTDPSFRWAQTIKKNELADLGPARIADMDQSGITVQVLSVAGPGADLVPGQPGIDLGRAYNDALAEACARYPARYRGFAHLPLLDPDAAAEELRRTVRDLGFVGALVNGPTDGLFLDDPRFDPVLAEAEALDVPIYIHPGIPSHAVRAAYFDGLPGNFSFTLALSAWGWHAETAIHTLRLALSGALDRHPGLKIVIGHCGEALPFMLDRIDETTAATAKTELKRSLRQALTEQVWITTSGFFTPVPFMAALMTFGVDRLMFSVDYPFASNARARAFLDGLPVSPADKAKIAHGNADALMRLAP
ncbi:MAG TPA: amidohydrolase family protein [Rhodopila sp.]|uniref:amidohydrolase family protein n=1 Tax=Rhodopila sp. TaxID=2480087 RepID=UPI002C3A2D63|nr:amidohydrolase family protein [Rhodopila sp.]HVY17237.1 amidohydrolase family protein [Rhodopila sp.]